MPHTNRDHSRVDRRRQKKGARGDEERVDTDRARQGGRQHDKARHLVRLFTEHFSTYEAAATDIATAGPTA